jgi:hypothetical protein
VLKRPERRTSAGRIDQDEQGKQLMGMWRHLDSRRRKDVFARALALLHEQNMRAQTRDVSPGSFENTKV